MKTNIIESVQNKILIIVFSFLTIIHHISVSSIGETLFENRLVAFKSIGVFCVGYFMLIMGYDAIRTLCEMGESNYRRKTLKILFSFFFCNYAYMIVTQIMGVSYSMKELITAFFGIQLLNTQMWLAVELLLFYLFLLLIFRKSKKENRKGIVISLVIVSLVIMVGSFVLGHGISPNGITNWFYGEWWYNTTPSFTVGVAYYLYQNEIADFMKKAGKKLAAICGIIFFLLAYLNNKVMNIYGYWTEDVNPNHYMDKLRTAAIQVPTVIVFLIFIIALFYGVEIKKGKNMLISDIFLELVLCNNIFIFICYNSNLQMGRAVFLVMEIIFTYIAATVIHLFIEFVFSE